MKQRIQGNLWIRRLIWLNSKRWSFILPGALFIFVLLHLLTLKYTIVLVNNYSSFLVANGAITMSFFEVDLLGTYMAYDEESRGPKLGWRVVPRSKLDRIIWRPVFEEPIDYFAGRYKKFSMPMWLLGLMIAIPTIILWWRNWRRPTGGCTNCNYNLTGNVSGVCPECGTTIKSVSTPTDTGKNISL